MTCQLGLQKSGRLLALVVLGLFGIVDGWIKDLAMLVARFAGSRAGFGGMVVEWVDAKMFWSIRFA